MQLDKWIFDGIIFGKTDCLLDTYYVWWYAIYIVRDMKYLERCYIDNILDLRFCGTYRRICVLKTHLSSRVHYSLMNDVLYSVKTCWVGLYRSDINSVKFELICVMVLLFSWGFLMCWCVYSVLASLVLLYLNYEGRVFTFGAGLSHWDMNSS